MSGQRGFVFAAMLLVLVLMAAIVGGAFFFALQEERLGRSAQASVRALAAAEAGAAGALAQWSPAREGALLPGDSFSRAVLLPPGAGTADVTTRAWGEQVVLILSHGADATRSAARQIALLIRLATPPLATPGVLVSREATAAVVGASVSTGDFAPPQLRCPTSPGPTPPPVVAPWVEPWLDWDSLAPLASPGAGFPSAARPIVLVDGDFAAVGGSGTGILMVAGDAVLDGGMRLVGAILVRGRLEFRGAGGQVIGAARAGSVSAASTALGGDPLVVWSSCAVARALRAVARPQRIKGWSWSDLSGGW